MVVRLWILTMLAACGRIGFDPAATGDDTIDPDGGNPRDGAIDGPTGDGVVGDGMTMVLPPGGETCGSAQTIMFGTAGTESIAMAVDDLNPIGCPDGPEIVYRISNPVTANHRVVLRPTFNASLTITNTCPPAGGACQTVIAGQSYDATPQFQTGSMFIIIDKSAGAGTTFELIVE